MLRQFLESGACSQQLDMQGAVELTYPRENLAVQTRYPAMRLELENHSVDHPEWNDFVAGLPNPLIQDGYIQVPETPGLGFTDVNEEMLRTQIDPDHPGYFEPTTEWDNEKSWDRLWS